VGASASIEIGTLRSLVLRLGSGRFLEGDYDAEGTITFDG